MNAIQIRHSAGSSIFSKVFMAALLALGFGYVVCSHASAATINCSHVNPYCQGTAGYDAITGWNNQNQIEAKTGRDDIWAYPGQDSVEGGGDGDNINGGDGDDHLYGDSGNDSYISIGGNSGIFGGADWDVMFGDVGEDYLEGNHGRDEMWGQDDNDWFQAEDGQPDTVGGGESSGYEPCYVDQYDTFTSCSPN